MEITLDEILRRSELDVALLHNPRVTKAIHKELILRGFRRVDKTVEGKRIRVYTNVAPLELEAGDIVEAALADKRNAKT
jgi:hypothetical protein